MDFNALIGQTLHEDALYETLKFEVEADSSSFKDHWVHIYFHETENLLQIDNVKFYKTCADFREQNKLQLGRRAFLAIGENKGSVGLYLFRLNTSGRKSLFTGARFYDTSFSDYDYPPKFDRTPMTKEEIREAFQELAGLLKAPSSVADVRVRTGKIRKA